MTKKQLKQAQQFNQMRNALIIIYKAYMTPAQIRKSEDAEFHGFDEALSMAYENIQETARLAVKGIRAITIEKPKDIAAPRTDMMDHGAY